MESDVSGFKIEKLSDSNYHAWKQKILHLLALKDLEDLIEDDPPADAADLPTWAKRDKKAQAVIGLSLSDHLLENVRDVASAKQMWTAIRNVFERHTLLNNRSARRTFYTATMRGDDNILQFANHIQQLASTLKSMGVDMDDSERAMALLNGLPDQYDALISALDALGTEESVIHSDFVKARATQEKQRIAMRSEAALAKSETSALLSRHYDNADKNSSFKPRPSYS